ncbi:hypothetical protein C8R46DRAFT_1124363 [Mycena filopes]|nr:hypothetical protein C8R46DRAFT_1124363 [Mycena filopes]
MAPQTLFSLLTLTALLGLASGSPTPTSAVASCSPPASATHISLTNPNLSTQGGIYPPGPMELGLLSVEDPFLFWKPAAAAAVGPWNLVKNGSFFTVHHTQVAGLVLTAVQSGGYAQLDDGPTGRQQWTITCTTCPPSGLANNCTFANSDPIPGFPQVDTKVCILNERIPDLGNTTVVGDCTGGLGAFQIDYHL